MRVTILTLLTMTFGLCNGQTMTRYEPMFKTCDQAVKQAHIDANAGILRSIPHGLVNSTRDIDFDRFYENYMIVNYGIESYNGGSIVMENEDCYNDEMNKIIIEKFGADFFCKKKEEVEREFEKFKILGQEERKKYIDFEYTYRLGMTDTRANYSKGYNELYKEIRKRINFSNLDFAPYKYTDIGIYLVIGQQGEIEKCEVVSNGFPETIGERIEKVIIDIGNWIPAKLYGHPVKSEDMLAFSLKD
tara:strand:+ start:54 stop:791 length:738 start_codon:yes stop_codon:yes gene_type:complete